MSETTEKPRSNGWLNRLTKAGAAGDIGSFATVVAGAATAIVSTNTDTATFIMLITGAGVGTAAMFFMAVVAYYDSLD